MLEVKAGRIDFPGRKGFGPQTDDNVETFSNPIQSYTVGLTGFEVKFDGADHHLHLVNIDVLGEQLDDFNIEVTCALALRDNSGNWDDTYSGYVAYAAVAVTEALDISTTELYGFVHSLSTAGSPTSRQLVIQLYIPIKEELLDLTMDLSDTEPSDLILTALLRDALALSLPVTCQAISIGDPAAPQYILVNASIKTRKIYHQAGWEVSGGQYLDTGDKETGTVVGKVETISVDAFGLIKESNKDLPDVAQVMIIEAESQERVGLFLGLQRADLDTNLSMLTMLLTAHKGNDDVKVGFYVEPLYRDDEPPVKWIQSVEIGSPPIVG